MNPDSRRLFQYWRWSENGVRVGVTRICGAVLTVDEWGWLAKTRSPALVESGCWKGWRMPQY